MQICWNSMSGCLRWALVDDLFISTGNSWTPTRRAWVLLRSTFTNFSKPVVAVSPLQFQPLRMKLTSWSIPFSISSSYRVCTPEIERERESLRRIGSKNFPNQLTSWSLTFLGHGFMFLLLSLRMRSHSQFMVCRHGSSDLLDVLLHQFVLRHVLNWLTIQLGVQIPLICTVWWRAAEWDRYSWASRDG